MMKWLAIFMLICAVANGDETTFYLEDDNASLYNTYLDGTWAEARDAATATSVDNPTTPSYENYSTVSQEADNYEDRYIISRMFGPVDTSGLPDDCVINSAILSWTVLYKIDEGANSLCLVASTQNNKPSIDADYDEIGTTELAGRKLISNLVVPERCAFTLNASGLAHINKTGVTYFSVTTSDDVDDSEPGTDEENTVYFVADCTPDAELKPTLVVTYNEDAAASQTIVTTLM